MRLNLHLKPAYQRQFVSVEKRFNLLFEDTSVFREIIANGLRFMNAAHADEKLNLINSNFFSEELLQAMICGGESYNTAPVNYIWQRLVDHKIVIRATGHMPGAFVDHSLVLPLLLEHLRAKTLANIFAPSASLIERYKSAIVAIDVRTALGSESRGTGFFAVESEGRSAKLYTCRHNVDPDANIEILRITSAAGETISFGTPRCHPTEDLAVIPVSQADTPELVFFFREEAEVFDEVYTLGFPMIPCAEASVVGHRGEVNGTAKLYLGGSDVLLISNLVSPGNSGGPMIDRDGFCIGMSIKWLEGEWEGERARFSAALPASLIKTL
jgi:S1-C subfamily serine protease